MPTKIRGQELIERELAQSGAYVDPLSQVPHIEEAPLDTQFTEGHALLPVQTKRAESLIALAELQIIEQGPSEFTDRWLAIARQNIYGPNFNLPELERSRMAILGLAAIYLDRDTTLRQSGEAYVMTSRARTYVTTNGWAEERHAMARDFGEFDSLDSGELSTETYISRLAERFGVQQSAPRLAEAKSRALFDYASTMVDCDEKRELLREAMVYANHAFSTADDLSVKGKSLRILASTLHDMSYLPDAFLQDDAANMKLVPEARNYAVTALRVSIAELEEALSEGGDTTSLQPVLDEARYFEHLYGELIRAQGIFTTQTKEIKRHISAQTAHKFGTTAVMYTLPSADRDTPLAA